jgi:hypothetical protein
MLIYYRDRSKGEHARCETPSHSSVFCKRAHSGEATAAAGVFSTGDELVEPTAETGPNTIIDTNRPTLLALLASSSPMSWISGSSLTTAKPLLMSRRELHLSWTS